MANKRTATLIALFLTITMTISSVVLPTANAAAYKTYPVFGATPNPVGVGQETLLLVGITSATASALYGWTGITVTVTKPDGTTETLGPFTTDSTGMTGYTYRPSMVGNYSMTMHFPEQSQGPSAQGIPANSTRLASERSLTLVVQQEPIAYYPGYPLPTQYWTRPIDDQLREWSPIAGNWLITPRNFLAEGNDYAPDSAHILWTTPLTSGGLVGGILNADGDGTDLTNVGYETGDAYEGKWGGSFGGGAPVVMGGKLYYSGYAAGDVYKNLVCVDLHTGKELWTTNLLNNLTLTRGQMHYWQTYDNQGVYDYLWATGNAGTRALLGLPSNAGTTWCAFDPFNGDFVYALYGIPSGTFAYGPRGEMLIYSISLSAGTIRLWNSTNIPQLYAGTSYLSMAWGQWRPMGKIVNATGPAGVTREGRPFTAPTMPLDLAGWQWEKTIPTGLPGSVRGVFTGDKVVGALINQTHVIAWAFSLKPGQEGTLLYKTTWTAPAEWLDGFLSVSLGAISNIDKVFTVNTREDGMRYGFSTETGEYLWKISEPMAMLAHLQGGPSGESGYIAYGMLFCGTMSGVVQAFNVTNGQLAWKYEVKDPYMQVLWSNNWPVGHLIAADGKIYFANLEHSVNQPLPRGGPFLCLNATTGDVLWRANGLFRQTVWGGRAVMGDSIIATMDTYDQRIYGIGKGPSAITAEAPTIGVPFGTSVTIRGMVTDISPGTQTDAIKMRFPNGVPAVSDESMSDWMLHVYKQFPHAEVTGVPVYFHVVDSNGNYRNIGETTTDPSGFYSIAWEPDISGKFSVIASFAGSNSYYPSYAYTAFFVEEPLPPPAEEPQQPPSMADTYFLPAVAGIIVVLIVIVVLLALLLFRKRP